MPIVVTCTNASCRKSLSVKAEMTGKRVRCPACKTPLTVSDASFSAAPMVRPIVRDYPVIVLTYPAGWRWLVLGLVALLCMTLAFIASDEKFHLGNLLLTLALACVAVAFLLQYFMNWIDRPHVILAKNALKLKRGDKTIGAIAYEHVVKIRIGGTPNDQGGTDDAIRIALLPPHDDEVRWPVRAPDGTDEPIIPDGFDMPLKEAYVSIRARCPHLASTNARPSAPFDAALDEEAEKSVGVFPLVLLGLLAVGLLIWAFLDVGGSGAALIFGTGLALWGALTVYSLAHQYLPQDRVRDSAPSALESLLSFAASLGRQFRWAIERPRLFASWVALESIGVALLGIGAVLLVAREPAPVVAAPAALVQAPVDPNPQPQPPLPVADNENDRREFDPNQPQPVVENGLTPPKFEFKIPPPVVVEEKKLPPPPQVIELVKTGDGHEKLLGSWKSTTFPHEEWWKINVAAGRMSVECAYFRNNQEVGRFHGENVRFAGGSVTFLQVFDRKPVASWQEGTLGTLMTQPNGKLEFTWVNGGFRGRASLESTGPDQPIRPGDGLEKLVGSWKCKDFFVEENWTIAHTNGIWKIACIYSGNGKELGRAQGREIRFVNGTLTFQIAFEKRPPITIQEGSRYTLRPRPDGKLNFSWTSGFGGGAGSYERVKGP